MSEMISIAKILKPHGLNGEVKVLPLTDFPQYFNHLQGVYLQNGPAPGQMVHIVSIRPTPKGYLLIKFAEFPTIESVEPLRHVYLQIPHESLFALPKGHYYVVDLIGCTVYLENKSKLGVVKDVMQTGANDNYVVQTDCNKEILIPAIKDCVKIIDIENKTIVIGNIDGLLDLD